MSAPADKPQWWELPLPGGGGVTLDRSSGLLAGIDLPPAACLDPVGVSSSLSLVLGGSEARALTGGLEYRGTERVSGPALAGTVEPEDPAGEAGGGRRVHAEIGGWSLALSYRSLEQSPRIRTSFELSRHGDSRPLRNVELRYELHLGDPAAWRLHAPGNRLRPGTSLGDLGDQEIAISPPTGSLGSIGLIALSHRDAAASIVLWPYSRSEIGWITLARVAGGLAIRVVTNLAGDPGPGETLCYAGVNLDVLGAAWRELRPQVRSWLASLGSSSPASTPGWVSSANIYEVQVGCSVFAGGYRYEPYPRLEDVTADLERIAGLGFDTVQLMPRQPYPSYNVVDYDDTATTYGGDESLATLVGRAHELGMRVVLDIVLHGVLDRRSVRSALDRVESSGVLDGPAAQVADVFADNAASRAALQRAWCQHIVDFAPYWIGGSEEIHPLIDAHPEWFCRDSSGAVTGIYTEAFDLADEEWQEWFCRATIRLVERFGLDGFRFDAPTYNNFANWSQERRRRASASALGCVALFPRLRAALKSRYPELMMFTEPSGCVLREAMDVNYNYDELWLIPSIMGTGGDDASAVRNGAELARWLDERDATLPAGALTAHHIDSHDTFWWPAPGRKWRREQIGTAATRAFMWCLALSGGPYMMFTGGEAGIEEDLRETMQLRRSRPELRSGATDYASVAVDDERVFAVLRCSPATALLVLVNLSPQPLEVACRLSGGWQVARFEDRYLGSCPVRPSPPASLAAQLGPFALAVVELERQDGDPGGRRDGEPGERQRRQ